MSLGKDSDQKVHSSKTVANNSVVCMQLVLNQVYLIVFSCQEIISMVLFIRTKGFKLV